MAPVGRPRVTTRQGSRAPVNEIGVADPLNYGVGFDPYKGGIAPWRMWYDTIEYVPEMTWPKSLDTLNQMRTDSQLAALVTAVMYGITQLRFLIDPNGARASLVKEVSEDLNLPIKGKEDEPLGRMKRRFSHHKFATQAMLAVIWGHMYFEQVGDIVDGKWRLRKLSPRMPRTIQQINVADDGGLVSIKQWMGNRVPGFPVSGGMAPEIPVDHLTAFVFQQEGYSWVGRSMMRDCFKDWLLKDRLQRIESINHERAGGVPYANAPMGATVDEISDLDQMMRQFRIGETSGGALPFGAELNIAKGSGSDIDKTIQRYNESMARKFLMMVANLAQGGQHVGSYALGDIFNDLWHVGQRAIAQWYCDVVNEHVIEDIVDWNYGEEEELVPKLTWERTREDSLGVTDLALLVQRGVLIVDDEIENATRYKYQLPKRTSPRPDYAVGPGVPRQPPENPPETKVGASAASPEGGAPSPEDAAKTKASFWTRLGGKKTMASTASIVTVPNVEILHAGVEYHLSTGPTTFTPEDLRDCVMAANEDKSIPSPRVKIGHVDPRYNDAGEFDGTPAFGKITNLSLSDNGMAVFADIAGVPSWLADIMPYAFPSRSVEGFWGVESQMGKRWRFVLSACSLLGVVWPGVTVIEDLPQYYGTEVPEGVVIDEAIVEAIAASKSTGGDPDVKLPFKRTEASANLDDVRRAFYNEYVEEHRTEGALWWWIQAVLVDPNELVVEDDETGDLYKIPFGTDSKGAVEFGEPGPVKIDYIPKDPESQKAAAAHVAATLAIGRKVAASWPNRAESRPANASGGAMDPKEIRKRLALPEDASDEQVQETLVALNEATGIKVDTEVPAKTDPVVEVIVEKDKETPAAAVVEAVAAKGIPEGMILIDSATLETLKVGASAGIEAKSKGEKHDRDQLVSAAIGDGRIAPAGRDHWMNLLEKDPTAKETLAALKKDLIPVDLRELGHAGGGAEGEGATALDPDLVTGWTGALFPETRQLHKAAAAAAEGKSVERSRIAADGNYRR